MQQPPRHCASSKAQRANLTHSPRDEGEQSVNCNPCLGEPNRGTLEYAKAGRRINTYTKIKVGNIKKFNFIFWGRLSKLKACSVNVAAPGVFCNARKLLSGLKRGPEKPGRSKYMCCVFVGGHSEVQCLFPLLPVPSPCRPLLLCPNVPR